MKENYLLILTDFYPFDRWEPYLVPEMKFLPKYFDRIYIFSNHEGNGKPLYELPQNVEAFFLSPTLSFREKISSLRFMLSPVFKEEMRWVKKEYKRRLSPSIIKIALLSLQQAKRLTRRIEKFLSARNLSDVNIFIYSYWADYRAVAAAMLGIRHSWSAITRSHGWDVYFERHAVPYLPFRKFLSKHLNSLHFVSEDGRNYFRQKIVDDPDGRLRLSRLAIEAQGINVANGHSPFVIVSCSRLVPLKRAHLVADILEHVKDIPLRWIHFGTGVSEDEFRQHVKEKIGEHANVEFDFRGTVNHEDLLTFYRAQPVDLFILTSEYEGMPFVIIEALAFGIPVMATDVGGIREAIGEENGFLLDKDFDPQEAAQKILAFASLPQESKLTYRHRAFQTWDRMFNAEKNFPAFIEEILHPERLIMPPAAPLTPEGGPLPDH